MIELVLMYKWTILAGILTSSALSLIGAQLASRNQAVQALVVSQAASFGVVLGLGTYAIFFEAHAHPHQSPGLAPLLSGLSFSAAAYFACEFLIPSRWSSRNTYYIGFFGILMALTYCLIALIPSLETHMASSYFGDLTVASDIESKIIGALSLAVTIALLYHWRSITSFSFETMIFGALVGPERQLYANSIFIFSSLLTISASVQFLGLLFTLCCLFLPAMILTRMQASIKGLTFKLVVASSIAASSGFIISIAQGSIPTVPTVALMLVISSVVLGLIKFPSKRKPSF